MRRLLGKNEFYVYLVADVVFLILIINFHFYHFGSIVLQLIILLMIIVLVPFAFMTTHKNFDHPERPKGLPGLLIFFSKILMLIAWPYAAFFYMQLLD